MRNIVINFELNLKKPLQRLKRLAAAGYKKAEKADVLEQHPICVLIPSQIIL